MQLCNKGKGRHGLPTRLIERIKACVLPSVVCLCVDRGWHMGRQQWLPGCRQATAQQPHPATAQHGMEGISSQRGKQDRASRGTTKSFGRAPVLCHHDSTKLLVVVVLRPLNLYGPLLNVLLKEPALRCSGGFNSRCAPRGILPARTRQQERVSVGDEIRQCPLARAATHRCHYQRSYTAGGAQRGAPCACTRQAQRNGGLFAAKPVVCCETSSSCCARRRSAGNSRLEALLQRGTVSTVGSRRHLNGKAIKASYVRYGPNGIFRLTAIPQSLAALRCRNATNARRVNSNRLREMTLHQTAGHSTSALRL